MRQQLTDGRFFDADKALQWDEDTYWDGRNHISKATESQWEHQALYRSASGTWIVHHWSQWQGSAESYEPVSLEEAAQWLSHNGHWDGIDAVPEADRVQLQNVFSSLEA